MIRCEVCSDRPRLGFSLSIGSAKGPFIDSFRIRFIQTQARPARRESALNQTSQGWLPMARILKVFAPYNAS
jgi:hypothetical protein